MMAEWRWWEQSLLRPASGTMEARMDDGRPAGMCARVFEFAGMISMDGTEPVPPGGMVMDKGLWRQAVLVVISDG